MNKIWIVLITAILCWTGCNPAGNGDQPPEDPGGPQTVFYISPDGNDAHSGGPDTPWRTLQHALSTLTAGDKVIVRPGIYREELVMERSGDEENKIYIEGESSQTVIIDGSQVDRDLMFLDNCRYVDISGLTFRRAPRAGLRLSYAHHIEIRQCRFIDNGRWGVFTDFSDYTTIRDCRVSGSGVEHGIYISNSSDNAWIDGNIVHHNYASGIQINADPSMGGDGISSECIIENNIIYENGRGGGAAVNLASVRHSRVQNNMIYNNFAGGIAAWDDGQGTQWGSKNLILLHNTVYFGPAQGRWAISLKNGSTGAEVFNNILIGGRSGGFEYNSGCLAGFESDYNIFFRPASGKVVAEEDIREYSLSEWQARGFDRHSLFAAAAGIFIDISSADFHLKNSGAAADGGTDRDLDYDYEGDSRPRGAAPDIGADEK